MHCSQPISDQKYKTIYLDSPSLNLVHCTFFVKAYHFSTQKAGTNGTDFRQSAIRITKLFISVYHHLTWCTVHCALRQSIYAKESFRQQIRYRIKIGIVRRKFKDFWNCSRRVSKVRKFYWLVSILQLNMFTLCKRVSEQPKADQCWTFHGQTLHQSLCAPK